MATGPEVVAVSGTRRVFARGVFQPLPARCSVGPQVAAVVDGGHSAWLGERHREHVLPAVRPPCADEHLRPGERSPCDVRRPLRCARGGHMKMRRALITGVTGQDGSYLAESLLDQGWEVVGAVRDPGRDATRLVPALAGRIE